MWFKELYQRYLGRTAIAPRRGPTPAQRRGLRLTVEQLEDRTLLSNYTAASVSDLIADINKANKHGGANTITLVAGHTFSLTGVDNSTDGPTGLPVIAAKNNLTIVGNGDVIERSTAAGTPAFRLFDVAARASLILQNLTLQGGAALGGLAWSQGGAVYNLGTLDLSGVTVQGNLAGGQYYSNVSPVAGVAAPSGAGGAIYSVGVLTLEGGSSVLNNTSRGAAGVPVHVYSPVLHRTVTYYTLSGGGLGAGVYVAGGTANLSAVTLSGNVAQGLVAKGGGLAVADGNVTLSGTILSANLAEGQIAQGGGIWSSGTLTVTGGAIQNNEALGVKGVDAHYVVVGWSRFGPVRAYVQAAPGGSASGGGLYVAGGTATLTSLTVSNNVARGGPGGHNTNSAYPGYQPWSGAGGSGAGGGVYVQAGTVNLTSVTLTGNGAFGGAGDGLNRTNNRGNPNLVLGYPSGGNGFGGGLYAAAGTVTLRDDTVTGNTAQVGFSYDSAQLGLGQGGGLFIDPAATVFLDAFTQAHATNNTASTSDPNIDGSYTLLP